MLDAVYAGEGERIGALEYEAFLAGGDPAFAWSLPGDEWDAIALNYTSGTTGNPKGVVYHHRGAYLNAVSNILGGRCRTIRCTCGRCRCSTATAGAFPWTVAAMAGTNVCLRKVEAKAMFDAIRAHGVTHYCGAPIVHATLVNAPDELQAGHRAQGPGMVAGAAPPAALIEGMERMGFDLTHVYGLTEVYGPATVCPQQAGLGSPRHRRTRDANARQGVRYPLEEGVAVLDPADHAARARRRRDDRRDHVPRQHHDEGLPEERDGHAGGVRRRLVPFGRPGGACTPTAT